MFFYIKEARVKVLQKVRGRKSLGNAVLDH